MRRLWFTSIELLRKAVHPFRTILAPLRKYFGRRRRRQTITELLHEQITARRPHTALVLLQRMEIIPHLGSETRARWAEAPCVQVDACIGLAVWQFYCAVQSGRDIADIVGCLRRAIETEARRMQRQALQQENCRRYNCPLFQNGRCLSPG